MTTNPPKVLGLVRAPFCGIALSRKKIMTPILWSPCHTQPTTHALFTLPRPPLYAISSHQSSPDFISRRRYQPTCRPHTLRAPWSVSKRQPAPTGLVRRQTPPGLVSPKQTSHQYGIPHTTCPCHPSHVPGVHSCDLLGSGPGSHRRHSLWHGLSLSFRPSKGSCKPPHFPVDDEMVHRSNVIDNSLDANWQSHRPPGPIQVSQRQTSPVQAQQYASAKPSVAVAGEAPSVWIRQASASTTMARQENAHTRTQFQEPRTFLARRTNPSFYRDGLGLGTRSLAKRSRAPPSPPPSHRP